MKNKPAVLFIIFGVVFLVNGCATQEQKKLYELNKATADLELVQEAQYYSGKIAVSDFDFVANKGQFNVTYNEDTSNYVQAARVNITGDASSSAQSAYYLGTMLQAAFAPPIVAGAPAGTNNPLAQTAIPNQAQTAVNGFTAPSALTGTPTADERDAVEKGINDKLAEEFLRAMANPDINTNKQAIVFAVMQATCEPGERTRRGFVAEMDISLKYGRHKQIKAYSTNRVMQVVGFDTDSRQMITNDITDELPASDHITNQGKTYYLTGTNKYLEVNQALHPSVLAVLPLMDSRNMELQNNNQSQVEIAAALSAAFQAKGLTAAASILSDYVKRQQSNIQTFNSLPVATAYADGSDFGFQLYPAAEALENPGQYSRAANVLEPVTFPIVVALKVDKSDMYDGTNVLWDTLVTEEQPHWIPIKWGFWHKWWLYTQWVIEQPTDQLLDASYDFYAYQPEYQLLYCARMLDEAKQHLNNIDPEGMESPQTLPLQYYFQFHQVEIAYDTLRASAISTEIGRPLPDDLFPVDKSDTNAPTITDVYPHTIWRDTNTDFLIVVKGPKDPSEVTSVNIAGYTCPNFVALAYGTNRYLCSMQVTSLDNTTNIIDQTSNILAQATSNLNQSVVTKIVNLAITDAIDQINNTGQNVPTAITQAIADTKTEIISDMTGQTASNILRQAITQVVRKYAKHKTGKITPDIIAQAVNKAISQIAANVNSHAVNDITTQAIINVKAQYAETKRISTDAIAKAFSDATAQVSANLTDQAITNVIAQYIAQGIATTTTTNLMPQGLVIKATLPNMFYSITNTATNNVDFAIIFTDLPPATKTVGLLLQGRSLPQPSVSLTRDASSKLLGINIQPGSDLTSSNLLDVINAVLQKSEPPPKIVNSLH